MITLRFISIRWHRLGIGRRWLESVLEKVEVSVEKGPEENACRRTKT